MGQRGKQAWSKAKLSIGTVRIRKNGRVRVRMIKVRDTGPISNRWINYARHWWLTNRGPIPEGKRVVHRDGNHLNDDPSNYVLASAGDVVYLAREWDPTLFDRNRQQVAAALAAHNRLRSRVTRSMRYLPDRWYAVAVEDAFVVNEPFRKRVGILRKYTGFDGEVPNGKIAAAWLGWPQVSGLGACMLAVLAGRPATFGDVHGGVNRLRELHGWGGPVLEGTIYSAAVELKRRRYLEVVRVPGRRTREYRATAIAIQDRGPECFYVAAKGENIDYRFPEFQRGPVV